MNDGERITYNKINTVENALEYARRRGIFNGLHESLELRRMINKVKKFNWNYNKNMIRDIIGLVNDYLNNRYSVDETRLQLYYVTGYLD